MREWLVIEDSRKCGLFASPGADKVKGYIPRDVAESLLGRSMGGFQWFTVEESLLMQSSPEWRETLDEPSPPKGGPT